MTTTVAERVRRHRERKKTGAAVMFVCVADEVAVQEWLISARLLNPLQSDDASALALAVGRMIDTIVAEDAKS